MTRLRMTSTHYIEMMTDAVFGAENFRNEITWKRGAAKNGVSKKYPRNIDRALYQAKSDAHRFNIPREEVDEAMREKSGGNGENRRCPNRTRKDIDTLTRGAKLLRMDGGAHWK